MVRAGKRAAILESVLRTSGFDLCREKPRAPRLEAFDGDVCAEIIGLYRDLGGTLDSPRLLPGQWDMAIREPSVVLELDEELHFNRYRSLTMAATWARELPWATPYIEYCDAHEDECQRAGSWGGRWTNDSCERMFGRPGEQGDLESPGSPRWKQRAIYDAMKDAYATAGNIKVARLAVHDEIQGVRLWDALDGTERLAPSLIRDLLLERIA